MNEAKGLGSLYLVMQDLPNEHRLMALAKSDKTKFWKETFESEK